MKIPLESSSIEFCSDLKLPNILKSEPEPLDKESQNVLKLLEHTQSEGATINPALLQKPTVNNPPLLQKPTVNNPLLDAQNSRDSNIDPSLRPENIFHTEHFSYNTVTKELKVTNPNNISKFFNIDGKINRSQENKFYAISIYYALDFHARCVHEVLANEVEMPNFDDNAKQWTTEFASQKGTNPNSKRGMFRLNGGPPTNNPRYRRRIDNYINDINQNPNA
jgi:hypothetical protein